MFRPFPYGSGGGDDIEIPNSGDLDPGTQQIIAATIAAMTNRMEKQQINHEKQMSQVLER